MNVPTYRFRAPDEGAWALVLSSVAILLGLLLPEWGVAPLVAVPLVGVVGPVGRILLGALFSSYRLRLLDESLWTALLTGVSALVGALLTARGTDASIVNALVAVVANTGRMLIGALLPEPAPEP